MIAGICLADEFSQVSIYNVETNQVETIDGDKCQSKDIKIQLDNLITRARKHSEETAFDKLVINIKEFDRKKADEVYAVMSDLGIDAKTVTVIGNSEAFASYMINQKRELHTNVSVLFDYSKDGLMVYTMNYRNYGDKNLCSLNTYDYKEEVPYGTDDVTVSIKMIDIAVKLMDGKVISSVYLTGEGFDGEEKYKQFIKYLCERRRVFVGQNLYVLGAAYYALFEEKINREYIFECDERIKADVFIRIEEQGEERNLRVAKCASSWYYIKNQYDFILDETNIISIYVDKLGERDMKCYKVELDEFPKRPKNTTRVGVEIYFKDGDTFVISIRDKGFGDIYKGTNHTVITEITI